MKEFIKQLIKSHVQVLNSLLKQYKELGGDVTTLDDTPECPAGYYYSATLNRCVLDVGGDDQGNG